MPITWGVNHLNSAEPVDEIEFKFHAVSTGRILVSAYALAMRNVNSAKLFDLQRQQHCDSFKWFWFLMSYVIAFISTHRDIRILISYQFWATLYFHSSSAQSRSLDIYNQVSQAISSASSTDFHAFRSCLSKNRIQ